MIGRGKERLETAEDAVEKLRGELLHVGVVLPSLGLDPVTAAGDAPYPLVELGRCNLDTAARLAAALEGARR
ncbi:hypothetical protein BJP40_25220 [Streptomyces sp. CC53]|uniref:hypothetical protein n=1 Tax=unclassified Streptomyces TaxID=2593676 RepID=UPI0008DDA9CA|nr:MULTISPECIES: hypothetical protein [unclassified Streptomyces]OII63300.1 hypothetical protein BJP40_25220 [Streptomyces sp. CC53]